MVNNHLACTTTHKDISLLIFHIKELIGYPSDIGGRYLGMGYFRQKKPPIPVTVKGAKIYNIYYLSLGIR